MAKKKIEEKKLNSDVKHSIMLRYFLLNPEKMWRFYRILYTANVLCHMQDTILQEINESFPYMTDQGIMQRMKNANKSFDRLLDGLYQSTKQIYHGNNVDDKYLQISDVAYKMLPMLDTITNDCAWHGITEYRFRELQKALINLVAPEAVEREMKDFIKSLREGYKTEYEYYLKADKNQASKEICDQLANMILTNHHKDGERK